MKQQQRKRKLHQAQHATQNRSGSYMSNWGGRSFNALSNMPVSSRPDAFEILGVVFRVVVIVLIVVVLVFAFKDDLRRRETISHPRIVVRDKNNTRYIFDHEPDKPILGPARITQTSNSCFVTPDVSVAKTQNVKKYLQYRECPEELSAGRYTLQFVVSRAESEKTGPTWKLQVNP